MRRRYEQTDSGAAVEVLIPETQEDLDEIEARRLRGEIDTRHSFGDRRGEVVEDPPR
jgi:hypothetical protein